MDPSSEVGTATWDGKGKQGNLPASLNSTPLIASSKP